MAMLNKQVNNQAIGRLALGRSLSFRGQLKKLNRLSDKIEVCQDVFKIQTMSPGYSLRDARYEEELQLDLLTSLSVELHQLLETTSFRWVNDLAGCPSPSECFPPTISPPSGCCYIYHSNHAAL